MANSIIMGNNIIKAEAILKIGQRLSFFSDNDSQNASRIEDILKDELIVAMPMTTRVAPSSRYAASASTVLPMMTSVSTDSSPH